MSARMSLGQIDKTWRKQRHRDLKKLLHLAQRRQIMILVEKESIIHSHGSNTVFLRGFQIQQGLKAGKGL